MSILFPKKHFAQFETWLQAQNRHIDKPRKREVLRVWLMPKTKHNKRDWIKDTGDPKFYEVSEKMASLILRWYRERNEDE